MKLLKKLLSFIVSLAMVFSLSAEVIIPAEAEDTDSFMTIVSLDAGRKYFSAANIETIIDEMSAKNYDSLELILGNDGLRFLLDDMSVTVDGTTYTSAKVTSAIQTGNKSYSDQTNYGESANELTQDEMDDILAYAKTKGISIIPAINSPGHMDAILDAATALTGTDCAYHSSGRTIDVTNTTAVDFTQALLTKYVDYFADKGCTYFNMGADEYANDLSSSTSYYGFAGLQTLGKYSYFVNYVNEVAKIIENKNMTPIAFNDGIYYNNVTNQGTFDTNIAIAYWTNGWSGYTVMSSANLAAKGHQIINTNSNWYYVLGSTGSTTGWSTWQHANQDTQNVSVTTTLDSSSSYTLAGSMLAIWCDTPSVQYSSTEQSHVLTLIDNQATATANASYFTAKTVEETYDSSTVKADATTVEINDELNARNNNFNYGWKFYLGTSSNAQNVNFNDSSWEDVDLPHDFSITQSFTTSGEAESGYLPGGTGWYRKSFTLPVNDQGKSVLLNFDGVYADAYVYVNGTYVGENHYGYTSFAFDISDYLTFDGITENVIAVKAVNNIPSSRWYSGSGIYRDVELIISDAIHVDWNGTTVTTSDIESGKGTVKVSADIVNDSTEDVDLTVTNTVYEKNSDQSVAESSTEQTIKAGETSTVTDSSVVSSPKLWSIDNPKQYTVVTKIIKDDVVLDSYSTDFGFRYYSFDSTNGFYLNGKAVKLNGVCMHHDQGALGSASYYDAMYRQISKLKDMGVNAIRITHNPGDEDFIDICNDLGVLVVEEAFDGWTYAKNGNSNDFSKYFNTKLSDNNNIYLGSDDMTWAEYAIKSMVRRDRNAPSIIMWSLCNEVQEGGSSDSTYGTIAQNLIDWIKEEDTTRTYTIGDNQKNTSSSTNVGAINKVIKNNGGVVGFNYATTSEMSSGNSAWGNVVSSETSSAVNSRGQYSSQANRSAVDGNYHLTSYDTSTVSWGKTAHESMYDTLTNDYISGEFVWTGWDYIGEPTPWNGTGTGSVSGSGAVPNSSYFGMIDTAGFEKDTYYLYRAQWNQNANTLHLVTAWDEDNMYTTGSKTPVVIYSNAAKVELYRNGSLIATASREVHTTSAGHTYYTYTTESNDTDNCTAVTGSNSTSLYATFNVAYEAGTISAKAYDEDGNDITSTCTGNTSLSTPGTVSKLEVTQDKTEIAADGSSLVYISVAVEDENGNLDTTATNTINFSLTGNGTIVGVDNGDQATTDKFQQSSVLTSTTSAKINAYAGKAIVIIKSTKDAGTININVTSSGLTGNDITVQTVSTEDESDTNTLESYTMVRDYSVKVGVVPELETTATGTFSDKTTMEGTITWNEIGEDIYNNAGDYVISGILSINDQEIYVSCRLHVIADVISMRNISTVTMEDTIPELPDSVIGIMADGSTSGEFTVKWDNMTTDQFDTVGDIVEVNGTATVCGSATLPVTAYIRVSEAVNTESSNVAESSTLTQDIASAYQSDTLSSVINGTTTFQDDTSERWSNWNNRKNSSTATLTFTWSTAQLLSSCNLYYYYDSCASKPANVQFQYSLNGSDYVDIGTTETLVTSSTLGAEYSYTFDKVINPISVRIILTQQSGSTSATDGTYCVALLEAQMMTYAGKVVKESSADLSNIMIDGKGIYNFSSDKTTYNGYGTTVTAESSSNAAITILPVYDGVVNIITLSEDGTTTKTYSISMYDSCDHETTELQDVVEATCTTPGYTGNLICTDCGETISEGTQIPAKGHTTELQNVKTATCTSEGYTGDAVCIICNEVITEGTTIAKIEHNWNDGAITTEATCATEGVKTYTCSVCGSTKTETIAATGHNYQETVTDPTCAVQGYTTYTCSKCGDSYKGNYIDALGHKWNEGTVVKEPTCDETGMKTYTCSVCNETKNETIAATGHTAVKHTAVAATCTTTGMKAYYECSVCGKYFTDADCSEETTLVDLTVAAKGHTWNAGVVTKEATEDETGVMTYTCTVCSETKTEVIPKTDHVHTYTSEVTDPTCTTQGYTTYTCSSCGYSYTADYTDALGHNYTGTVTTEPTCTTAGVRTYTCSRCGDSYTETIAATGHTVVAHAAVAATCTSTGTEAYYECSVCGKYYTDEDCTTETTLYALTVAAKGHTWNAGVVTKEATENETGIRTYTCTICGETKTEVIAMTDHVHSYTAVVTDPTCTKQGYTTYTCAKCGDSYKANYTSALGHNYTSAVTTEPTCTEAGVRTYTCSRCGDSYTETIAATGHTVTKHAAVAATCTTTGMKAYYECSVCGKYYTDEACTKETTLVDLTVAAKGHTWDAGKVTTKATNTTEGVRTYTCSVCGKTKTESISRISSVKLYKGVNKTYTLTSSKTASWKLTSSKYKKYVTLSKNKITVKKTGTVKVYDSKSKQYVTIYIKTPTISTKTSVSVSKGKSLQLSATATPSATVKYYVTASKYKKYATVTTSGKVKGIKKGTCYIYAKANGVKKKIKVTVK